MRNRKLLAIVLAFVLIFTQFSMLGIVSAESSALTGRENFMMGVNIRHAKTASDDYTKAYDTILDAKALGSNIVRIRLTYDESTHAYDVGTADLALKNGMQVMAVSSLGYYDTENECLIPAEEINIAGITETYTAAATALKGKVAYYQIGNEMNGNAVLEGLRNGMTAEDFKDVSGIAVALYAANKAIKDVDPEAKTVVNFSWSHTGFIDALKAVKIDADTGMVATESTSNITYLDWDVIGLDWYSKDANADFTNEDGSVIDYDDVIIDLNEKYPNTPVIVCEANLSPVSENEDGTINYVGDASWFDEFLRYCYSNDKVIGFIAHELYDEPSDSYDADGNYSFNKESHFGLIDKDGNKKATYNTLCALYGGTGEMPDRTIPVAPALNNEGELKAVFQSNVVSADFPRTYSAMEVLTVENQDTDFSQGEFIEFDFYVEDAEAYKAAMSRLGISLCLQAYSDEETYRDCRFITEDYIVADGWNHIKVAKQAFFDFNVDWSSINKFVVKFFGTNIANYSELSGMKLAIANICSTNIEYPENVVNDDKIVIDEAGYAEPINRKIGFFSGNSGKALNPVVDISACEKIEFDLYVENLEFFKKTTETNELILRFISDSTGAQNCRYYLSQYVTKQGWNHIEIIINNYDAVTNYFSFSTINKYRLEFSGEANQELPYPATYIAFKNFNAVKYILPELPSNIDKVIMTDGFSKELGQGVSIQHVVSSGGYSVRKFLDTPVDLSNSDFIEFDVYVEDVDILKAYSNLYLSLYTNGSADAAYRADYAFADQVTKTGWNHIKVAKSAAASRGATGSYPYKFVWTDVTAVVLMTYNSGAPTGITGTANVIIANVCGTLEEYKVLPELPKKATVATKEGKIFEYGNGKKFIYSSTTASTLIFDSTDFSESDYIEFDLYLENAELLKGYQTPLYLSLFTDGSTTHGDKKRADLEFTSYLDSLKNGWNHIKIAKSTAVTRGATNTNNVVWARVTGMQFSTNSASVTPASGTAIARIANVCGTLEDYKVAPELPVNAISSSTVSVISTYGNNMSNIKTIKTTFDSPLNLSNADYIEFDVYVENAEHFHEYYTTNVTEPTAHKFYFVIYTSKKVGTGNVMAYYDYHNLITKDGWNHIKIAVGDYTTDFTTTPDFSSVISGGFYFTRGAANYVHNSERFGFANVCGTSDLTVPTEVMKNKIDFIGATLNSFKFDAEGVYSADLEKAVDISGDLMMIELDVFVSGDALTKFEVELVDNADGYAVYSFEDLSAGWNRLAIRLSDSVEGEVDFANITGYAFYGTANTSVIVSNFYAAAYVKGDGNRDGLMDIRDLVAMKKYIAGITLSSGMVGNKVAMDVAGNDGNVNSLDLSEFRRYFLTDKWSEN